MIKNYSKRKCFLIILTLAFSTQFIVQYANAQESTSKSRQLRPFKATYDSIWYPLSIRGSATRSLQATGTRTGRFSFEGKLLTTTLIESSSLNWQDCNPKPQNFSREKKQLFQKKLIDKQTFNWSKNLVNAQHKNNTRELKIPDGTHDPLSYQLALRCDLKQGKSVFEYQVVRKTKVKKYSFKIIGKETIDTPLGILETIKVNRSSDKGKKKTTLWFSTKHDFALVKLEQQEAEDNHYMFTIRELYIY